MIRAVAADPPPPEPPRLEPLPEGFRRTREALHRVAAEIVAPARKPHNEIALRVTPGGFGTPPFEFDGVRMQVRVAGPMLVVSRDGEERRTRVGSLADAAGFVGEDLFPDGPPGDREQLDVDSDAARALGELYAFSAAALERFRGVLAGSEEPSEIILWPEHFDIAFEAGPEARGLRANYGVSPGDEQHFEPYLYVGPWTATPGGELWNAVGFSGAELAYGELVTADDQIATAEEFFESRRRALKASG